MKLKIQKWGNSAAVKLPTTMLSKIGATIGDTVVVDLKSFRVVNPKYKLDVLLNQCDKNAKPPTDMSMWEMLTPVDREII